MHFVRIWPADARFFPQPSGGRGLSTVTALRVAAVVVAVATDGPSAGPSAGPAAWSVRGAVRRIRPPGRLRGWLAEGPMCLGQKKSPARRLREPGIACAV